MGRVTTGLRAEMVSEWLDGVTISDLAAHHGLARRTVRNHLHQAGIYPKERPRQYVITNRDRALLELVANGRTDRQISVDLSMPVDTIKSAMKRIYEILGIPPARRSRTRAIAAAYQRGILTVERHVDTTPNAEVRPGVPSPKVFGWCAIPVGSIRRTWRAAAADAERVNTTGQQPRRVVYAVLMAGVDDGE
jgi:DNA-binding CsgD family transcriptional regulator